MPFTEPIDPQPIRARFYVASMTIQSYATQVLLRPVTKGGNKSWSEATPSGELTMTITNKDAVDQLAPNQEWDILFTPATDDAPNDFG